MELTSLLSILAVVLPVAYGAPAVTSESLHPEILNAMKRDLGLNTEQAVARVNNDHEASRLIEKLGNSLDSGSFAGGWIAQGKTFVGVTDQASAEHVTAAGATPVVVSTSLSKLQGAKEALDQHLASSVQTRGDSQHLAGVASYFVDVAANKLVVEALGDDQSQQRARELASRANLGESDYEIRIVNELPRTTATNVIGGDAYVIDSKTRCSIGFSVTGGFVSAGHCGQKGSAVTAGATVGGEALGTFAGSTFPGNDFSYIKTVSSARLIGAIDNYQGGTIPVKGSSEAAVGASVCRSGSTTQVHCGTIQGKDQTVVLDGTNTVYHLTKSSACCDHGDSGGSFYAGSQGQGVTSGANGNCNNNGYSYFQPLNPILQNYGVSLITS